MEGEDTTVPLQPHLKQESYVKNTKPYFFSIRFRNSFQEKSDNFYFLCLKNEIPTVWGRFISSGNFGFITDMVDSFANSFRNKNK